MGVLAVAAVVAWPAAGMAGPPVEAWAAPAVEIVVAVDRRVEVDREFVRTAELATALDEAIRTDGTLTDQAMVDAAVTVLMAA